MFTVYGSGVTNPIALDNLFVRPAVTETAAVAVRYIRCHSSIAMLMLSA